MVWVGQDETMAKTTIGKKTFDSGSAFLGLTQKFPIILVVVRVRVRVRVRF